MTRILLLVSSICSLFVLSWGVGRAIAPQSCINSKLVSKVVIVETAQTIPTCNIWTILTAPTSLPLEVTRSNLLRRLEHLNELAPYTDTTLPTTSIYILTELAASLAIENHSIKISGDNLNQPGVLERAVLVARLQNGRPQAASATADFLWHEFVAADYHKSTHSWRTHLTSIASYCRSNSRLLLHFDFCTSQMDFVDSLILGDTPQVVPWGLNSLYSQILGDIYRSLSLADKTKMLRNLIFLDEPEDLFIEKISTQKVTLAEQEAAFVNMVKSWLLPLGLDSELVTSLIQKYTLQAQKESNLIYVGRSSRDTFPLNFESAPNSEWSEPLIVQFGTARYFYPSDVQVRTSHQELFKLNKIKNVIYISCTVPDVESLLEFKAYAKRVVYIKQCKEEELNWTEIGRMGLNPFLKQNPTIEFIEFNLSAIELAERVRGPLRDSQNFVAWQRWLIWSNSVRDEDVSIRRPLSVIDGVNRYRIY